jgi:type III secretion protein V
MKKNYALLSIDFAGYIQRYTDIFIGLILLFVLALLLLPIPPFVLDMAIAANFAFSLIVLATAVYLRSPTQLASFPALLLLTTLFRLAISIASTKMILLHAHAGEMIHAFGALVVGGSVAVGLVVFVLLSAVQIIVVAKGADRVAEVAARFTLDGIPGRQMSVDADLRAGLINAADASARRDKLEQETHLMGSLDGAMKFVKGDAIATVVVALVNIVGGIACGMLIKKMSFGEAVQVFTILTIGDGLVSQLPSLVVCIAAGIIITRVAGDKHGGHLGADIYEQLVANPKAILMAAFASFALAVIPGFPHLQFAAAGGLLLMMGVALMRQATIIANSQRASMPEMARDGASYTPRFLDDVEQGTAAPLRLRLGDGNELRVVRKFEKTDATFRRYLACCATLPANSL